ncbi:MAG: hypothetical protein MI974_18835 [Chitinophagales bacterium]|nr:hypothetical protein [Chitinophagales bacterium]
MERNWYFLFLCISIFSCTPEPCEQSPVDFPEKKVTVFLVDASNSFNRINKQEGIFYERNYFDLACRQIKDSLLVLGVGGVAIIRFIGERSWGTRSFITQLDLTNSDLYFSVPMPCDPFSLEQYRQQKVEEDSINQLKIQGFQQQTIEEITNFQSTYALRSVKHTDLCGALAACNQDIKAQKYLGFTKELVIYSDLQNSFPSSTDCEFPFDFTGVKVQAKFVVDDDHSANDYEELKKEWESFFAAATSFDFLNPTQSN